MTFWDFLTSIVLQNIETNEGETLWCNPKISKKSRIVPEKKSERNGGSLECFQGTGRRCFRFGRGSGVSSMFLTSVVQVDVVEQMNKKVDLTRLKNYSL